MEGQSEVARLLAQINSEYEAAQLGLSGLSQGNAQHAFMTKRTENIAALHAQLREQVGDQAMELITEYVADLHAEEGAVRDPGLIALARELRETAPSIDPAFREELRVELLQQFNATREGKP